MGALSWVKPEGARAVNCNLSHFFKLFQDIAVLTVTSEGFWVRDYGGGVRVGRLCGAC
jgi:hypothetical protein